MILAAELIESSAGAVLARGQPTGTLIDWCKRLAETMPLPEAVAEPIKSHLTAADGLLEQRHDVAHSRWFLDTTRGTVTVRLKRGSKSSRQTWTVTRLATLRQDLLNLAGDLDLDRANVRRSRNDEELLPPRLGDVLDRGAAG